MKKVLALIIAASCLTGVAAAASTPRTKKQQEKKAAATITEVRVCPMSGEAVKGEGAGSETVGNYKVYFCCADCKEAFGKLSAEVKEKKVAAALAKQESKKKG